MGDEAWMSLEPSSNRRVLVSPVVVDHQMQRYRAGKFLIQTAQEFQKMNDVVYAELDEVAKRAEAAPLPKKEVDLTSIYASAEVADG